MAGRGPLPLALAGEILMNKGQVRILLDETHVLSHLKYLYLLTSHRPKIWEGVSHFWRLFWNRVPVATRTRVVEAQGRDKLEAVVTMKTDSKGKLLTNSKKVIPTSFLAIGHGFVPNIELAVQIGCRIDYEPEKGGWIVRTNDELETTAENIFAIGEITGVAGAQKSFLEGQIAGLSILNRLGLNGNNKQIMKLAHDRVRHLKFGKYVNSLSRLSLTDLDTIPDDTIICRCENVTLGKIKHALTDDFLSWPSLKKATRCGMGRCQGRICGPILDEMLTVFGYKFTRQLKPYSVRFPVKSIPLNAFCSIKE